MFAGLVLTSISTVMLRAALFQRKSRSGWLEELDGIREDALLEHDGGVANVADAEDIWTDLRDGGEYEDPHEIASLYATDATPDQPGGKPPKPAKATHRSGRAKDTAPPTPDAASTPSSASKHGSPLPAPPPPAPVAEPVVDAPAATSAPEAAPASSGATPASGAQYDDQIWVQPAPHPIRPSEMWHPAELAPVPLGQESFDPVIEERIASSDLMDPTYAPRLAEAVSAEATPQPADDRTVARLESELVAVADATVVDGSTPLGPTGADGTTEGLVNGPVGRRVRRDRPRAALPPPETQAPAERGEQSPLPTIPLPPAALPSRSNRLPSFESLPATPSSVVAPRSVAPAAHLAAPAPSPVADQAEAEVPAVPAPQPVAVTEDAAASEPTPVAAPITIGEDGLVAAPGTIVRIGGERQARAAGGPSGVVVALDEGWCWASPGEGAAAPLRVELPAGSLTVDPGATALAVVEADGSVFVIVAAGFAYLARDGDGATVGRGTIVMVDPTGAAQTDAATDAEIESDPIVAENLALDAEL